MGVGRFCLSAIPFCCAMVLSKMKHGDGPSGETVPGCGGQAGGETREEMEDKAKEEKRRRAEKKD